MFVSFNLRRFVGYYYSIYLRSKVLKWSLKTESISPTSRGVAITDLHTPRKQLFTVVWKHSSINYSQEPQARLSKESCLLLPEARVPLLGLHGGRRPWLHSVLLWPPQPCHSRYIYVYTCINKMPQKSSTAFCSQHPRQLSCNSSSRESEPSWGTAWYMACTGPAIVRSSSRYLGWTWLHPFYCFRKKKVCFCHCSRIMPNFCFDLKKPPMFICRFVQFLYFVVAPGILPRASHMLASPLPDSLQEFCVNENIFIINIRCIRYCVT